MGSMKTWTMAAGALTLLAGCGSSFSSSPADGGHDSDTDASHETGAGDAGADVDADAADASTSWCSTQKAAFCEDFDEYPTLTALTHVWSPTQLGGTLLLDTKTADSPPNALRAMSTTAKDVRALVVKTFTLTSMPEALELDFAMKINSPGMIGLGTAAGLVAIASGSGVDDGYVALAIGNQLGTTKLEAAWLAPPDAGLKMPFNYRFANSPLPPTGTWGSYTIAVDFATSCLEIFSGSVKLLDSCLSVSDAIFHATKLSIVLGAYAGSGSGMTGDLDVEFDNVTFSVPGK
jgi:hypothetical protein